jgi:hypothetical protein
VISFEDGGGEVTIGVSWVTVDSLRPGRPYAATLSILDGAGKPLAPKPGFRNPLDITGRIVIG